MQRLPSLRKRHTDWSRLGQQWRERNPAELVSMCDLYGHYSRVLRDDVCRYKQRQLVRYAREDRCAFPRMTLSPP